MNNKINEFGNLGANIQPSARKSIHSNCKTCPFTRSESSYSMGKYGIRNKEKRILERSHQTTTSSNEGNQGIDVVDNVMSKFAHPSSPKLTTRKSRRNSVDSLNDRHSNESDDEDESDDSPELNRFNEDGFNSSESLIYRTPQRARGTGSDITNSFNISTQSNSSNKSQCFLHENSLRKLKSFTHVAVLVIAMLAITLFYNNYDFFNVTYATNNNIYDETKFHNYVTYLGEKYKVTDNSILQIQTGISTIFQNQDTGSFIFMYNSLNSNYDPIVFNNFMNDIATAAAKYLRNESNAENHVVVDSSKLDMRFHTELIEKYRDEVRKSGVMLVKDLDEVPSSLAMAFHYYCDEFNPLVKKSAILFTLNVAKCPDQKTNHASIEKCLAKKWTTVPKANIIPLLTRVVNIVIDVTSVF